MDEAKQKLELQKDFSRNVNDFKLNQYCQTSLSDQPLGIWYQTILSNDEEVAVEMGYRCQRKSFSSGPIKISDWEECDRRTRALAQLAMSHRSIAVIGKLTDPKQYQPYPSHVCDAKYMISPSLWMSGNPVEQALKYADSAIRFSTHAAVNPNECVIVLNPDTAAYMCRTDEIKGIAVERDRNGFPAAIYGKRFVVEDTVIVSNGDDGKMTVKYVFPDGAVAIVNLPPGMGVDGGRTFASITLTAVEKDEMRVEIFPEQNQLFVVDNFDVNMTCPVSGFLLLNLYKEERSVRAD